MPANPKSDDQITQRGFLTEAVRLIHYAQALADDTLDKADQIAYALYGSIFPTPRTWFNTIVKDMVDCRVAGKSPCVLCNGAVAVDVALQLTFSGKLYSPMTEDGDLYWGLTKTNMPNSIIASAVAGDISAVASPTVKGTKYFLQWKPRSYASIVGMHSGIYTATSI